MTEQPPLPEQTSDQQPTDATTCEMVRLVSAKLQEPTPQQPWKSGLSRDQIIRNLRLPLKDRAVREALARRLTLPLPTPTDMPPHHEMPDQRR